MTDSVLKQKGRLSLTEASSFKHNVIDQWKPKSEVWHFNHGGNIAALLAGGSGGYITYYVRKHLKLRPYAPLTCYIPTAFLSAFLSETTHDLYINASVLTGRSCPACLSTKAALIQVGLGVVYPLILAPLIGFYLADKLLTYPIPSISRAPSEILRLWWKLVSKNQRPLVASAVLQAVIIGYATHAKQGFVFDYVQKSLTNRI